MSNSIPPDLRVLCRKLSTIPPQQLPHSLPCLVNHVLHCKGPLSAPQEQKLKGDSPEVAQLVHKLKASVTSLLKSRTKEARFTAVALVKAMVDVGGWEVLRGSFTWVQDLLSIVQKSDPLPAKELAIVTLARIYVLLHPYQTLVREIATPTIPTFARACMNLIKASSTPAGVIETVCDAFSLLIPLYPPTFRPFTSETHNALKSYLAPTGSDLVTVPTSLVRAARRTNILQHYVAAKSGGSEEWAKLVDGLVTNFHTTADHVFRAVNESWEPSAGITKAQVDLDSEPQGLGDLLPPWYSLEAGAQRLVGLLGYIADCLKYTTKSAVTIPLNKITEVVARVCLIARLSPKTQTWEQALQTNAAIGREEKEELWSSMPDIHIAALHLVQTLLTRLDKDMLPLAQESLDHLVRVFKSNMSNPVMRSTGYTTLNDILSMCGPTLSKQAVGMLDPLIGACCRDLQEHAGHLKPASKPPPADTKKNGLTANADLFLQQPQKGADAQQPAALSPGHRSAASALLATTLSSLPQQHLKPSLRSLLDQTAILAGDRDAMLASVLSPYRDQRGRIYPSILPHLAQQFPEDRGLEILRTNLRRDGVKTADDEVASVADAQELDDADEEMGEDAEEEQQQEEEVEDRAEEPASQRSAKVPDPKAMDIDVPSRPNPFESAKGNSSSSGPAMNAFGNIQPRAASPPKRKHEGADPAPPKRQEVKAPSEPAGPPAGADDSDDSDESVHLNMELEDDDDDEDED